MNNIEKSIEILKKHKQEHIIDLMQKIDENKQQKLANQVLQIDFEEIEELYKKTFEDLYVDLEELQPITAVNPNRLSKEQIIKLKEKGANIIKNNKFAIATMAGGQGTRLRPSWT